jgi:hypothetical protein
MSSYKLFGFLGDVGGVQQALQVIASLVGLYWSSSMFKIDFVETIYNDSEKSSLNFSTIHVLLEPIIATLINIFCICKSCSYCRIKRNQLLMDKARESLDEVFDITTFIARYIEN